MSDNFRPEEYEDEQEAPKDETPAERFSRIATRRLRKVLDDMRLLTNCAGPGYEYTPEQVEKINTAIAGRFAILQEAFSPTAPDDAPTL